MAMVEMSIFFSQLNAAAWKGTCYPDPVAVCRVALTDEAHACAGGVQWWFSGV